MKTTLNFSTSEVNRNFLIKVFSKQLGLNTLLGVDGLVKLVGEKTANKFLTRAFASMDDYCICKIYGAGKVTFYRH